MYHGYVLKIFNGNKTKTEMMKHFNIVFGLQNV